MRYFCLFFLLNFFTLILNAQNISTYVRTNWSAARIEVDASRPASFRVPRTIYGTFLENIGHAIFGGVSAELLDNPSLENYDASLQTLEHRFHGRTFQYSSKIGVPLPWLDVLATMDSRRHNLSLFDVNRNWEQAFPAEIRSMVFQLRRRLLCRLSPVTPS